MTPSEIENAPAGLARVPRRVWGGTGLMVLGRIWGSACTLVILILATIYLSGPDFGRFTFYLALFLVLDAWADLGTGQAAVQRTASAPERLLGVLGAARRIRFVTGCIGALVVTALAYAYDEPGAHWIALASLYPITHVLELSTVVWKNSISWSRPVAVRMIASTLSLAFVGLTLARGVREPAPLVFAVAAGSTLGNLLLHALARRDLPRTRAVRESVRELFWAALPMGIAGLCQQTYFYVDNLFVRASEGEDLLGRYNLAVRIMSYGIMLAVYAPMAALPWLAREQRAGRLGAATARLSLPLFTLASLCAGLAWPFAGDILALFGEPFRVAEASLHWLLLATLTVYLGASFLTAVVASGGFRSVLWISASALLLNVVGNSLLVPRMGIEGAAIATLATEGWVVIGALIALARGATRPLADGRAWIFLGGPAAFFFGRWLAGLLAQSFV